ncbi:zinc ABC transporter substrate-binding protein [Streptosporangium pseudovulgare]|uniref:Zinc ABC transporter substrate-binding protein n=2 Tax=Streptosporangium pseudovulgare TaxID=35765 RepID=A0ABQ2QHC2_9ACTN|nr:zinc ABC transporter substrate-binding protein [Streptosporangium pseudovulgare]
MHTAGALALMTVLATTAACGSGSADSGKAEGAFGVSAAMYPLQWLTERVGGPDIAVTGLAKPGVEPHDLELSPIQVARLEETGLVVYIRGVQPAVDEAVEQHAADRGFDAATAVRTLPATAGDEHAHEHAGETGEEHAGEHGDGTGEEHAGEHGDEHAGEGGSPISYDPHIWLDPSRFATVATKLGERLAAADPAHAQGYRERAAKVAAELTALDGEMTRGLRTCASNAIVTSHAAFAYLADRYRLRQIGVSGVNPDAEPAPARLAQVAEVARREKVTTIFTESLVSPKVAEVLASEVGAKTAVLDPIESRPASGDYTSAMRRNLTALQAALRCA